MKRTLGFLIILGLIVGAVAVGLLFGPAPTDRSARLIGARLYEYVDEPTRAKIFAFRSLARAGLIDPHGKRSYLLWDREAAPTSSSAGWRVALGATDCAPRENVYTCRPIGSGEEPDTFVTVSLNQDRWKVTEIEGEMLAHEKDRLTGFTLPDKPESSHWDFAAVGVDRSFDDLVVQAMPIWVGPFPTDAPGSVCEVTTFNAEENPTGTSTTFYQERPTRPFDVVGWVRGAEAGLSRGVTDAAIECAQRAGGGWALTSEPRLLGSPGSAYGAEVRMEWQGDRGFTAPLRCHVSLLDDEGEVVWEDIEFPTALWRPEELRSYPYERTVTVHTPPSLPATRVGDFDCESL